MGPDELFEATAQAMLAAIDRDASSGYGVVIHTITKVIFGEFITQFNHLFRTKSL
jgi:20S proteasome alpha/beta subunit